MGQVVTAKQGVPKGAHPSMQYYPPAKNCKAYAKNNTFFAVLSRP
jgi:hypothetical protein